jgi:dTMP kinase
LQHDEAGHAMVPETVLLLFAASRAQLVREVIAPALARGTTVIADRFLDSTTVYQGVARQIEEGTVRFVNDFAVTTCRPDLTFLLDLNLEAADARIAARPKERADRMEEQPAAFYEAVRDGYLHLAAAEPDRICVLPAEQPVEDLAAAIWARLQQRFHGLFT